MLRRFVVEKDERALLTRNGEFVEVLRSGSYWFFDPLRRLAVENFSLTHPRFEHPLAERIAVSEPQVAAREFHVLHLGPREVGLRYENGVLVEVLPPDSRHWYWRAKVDVRCVVLDITHDYTVARSLVPLLVMGNGAAAAVAGADAVLAVRVPECYSGVLTNDGKTVKRLAPGLHAFWRYGRNLRVDLVARPDASVDCPGGREAAAA